jgi:hypothetical protein
METVLVHIVGPFSEESWYSIPRRYITDEELSALNKIHRCAYRISFDEQSNTTLHKYNIVMTKRGAAYCKNTIIPFDSPIERRMVASFLLDDQWDRYLVNIIPEDWRRNRNVILLIHATALIAIP